MVLANSVVPRGPMVVLDISHVDILINSFGMRSIWLTGTVGTSELPVSSLCSASARQRSSRSPIAVMCNLYHRRGNADRRFFFITCWSSCRVVSSNCFENVSKWSATILVLQRIGFISPPASLSHKPRRAPASP